MKKMSADDKRTIMILAAILHAQDHRQGIQSAVDLAFQIYEKVIV